MLSFRNTVLAAVLGALLAPAVANAQGGPPQIGQPGQIAVPAPPNPGGGQGGLIAYPTNDLNLRSGPGTQYPVLVVMPRGSQMAVQYCEGSGNWCYGNWAGYSGWASAQYLSTTPPVYQPQPVPQAPPPPPMYDPGPPMPPMPGPYYPYYPYYGGGWWGFWFGF